VRGLVLQKGRYDVTERELNCLLEFEREHQRIAAKYESGLAAIEAKYKTKFQVVAFLLGFSLGTAVTSMVLRIAMLCQ
jgi:hypothetical protein